MAQQITGAQVVARSIELLKLISIRTEKGWLVQDLVTQSGLTRPTVYRLVAALEAGGLIEQDRDSRRWHLGQESYVIGTLAAERFNIERISRDSIVRVAQISGESTFLSIRRGNESVCLLREEGTYPIRTHVLQAGDRLPLGVGSAGLAMLAALPEAESDAIIEANRPQFRERYPRINAKLVKELVAEARQTGYAVNRGFLLTGSWGIAAPISVGMHMPPAAISITAVEARLQPKRQQELGSLLATEAANLRKLLAGNQGS
jgi:DNA-binding IclR family transcriptional regulator